MPFDPVQYLYELNYEIDNALIATIRDTHNQSVRDWAKGYYKGLARAREIAMRNATIDIREGTNHRLD